jgi:FtsH-binding integral membrane protein
MDIIYQMNESNSNMDDIYIYCVAFIMSIVIIILINTISVPLTTKGYITNSYLYILLALIISSLVTLIMDKYKLMKLKNFPIYKYLFIYLLVFAISIIMIFAILYTKKENIGLRHFYWLLFVISMAIIIYPSYELTKDTGVLWKSSATVIIILIGLTIISSKYPDNAFDSWGSYLMIGLSGLIIFQLLDIAFTVSNNKIKKNEYINIQKIYAVIGIIIFCGFILYDTKKIRQNAHTTVSTCKDLTKHLLYADYPSESLGLFLDLINLFSNFNRIYSY